uniref:Putative C4 protein n=1 Tax=Pepper yellow leaf curl Indonesia virus-[Tomato3] TaxID=398059 RepID=Q5CCY5_9GEMI|nr:putative C4 protein [Pepper yellow leaf curl Indonesia virus-[Tomato3]]
MGALISMYSYNSKGNTSAPTTDSSTWYPQPGQHISIRTFRELNQVPMSRRTWTKTVTQSNGENFRYMADLHEVVSTQQTMFMRRPNCGRSQMLFN